MSNNFKLLIFFILSTSLLFATEKDSTAIIIFAGDLNFSTHFEKDFIKKEFNPFENIHKIGFYDHMMVNLENAITCSNDFAIKQYVFKMKPELLRFFSYAKITIVNCANNHTGDYRYQGIIETIDNLKKYNIDYVGIGKNIKEARKPLIKEVNNIKLGFLGYADIGTYIATDKRPGRAPINKNNIIEDINQLKNKVDYIIVNLHWGIELAKNPTDDQIKLAHIIIDSGADLIIGHHPHILQGIEKYKDGFIVYSLGNFIFGGNKNSKNSETAVIKAIFNKSGLTIEPIPIILINWQPAPAENDVKTKILSILYERSEYFKNYNYFAPIKECE